MRASSAENRYQFILGSIMFAWKIEFFFGDRVGNNICYLLDIV